ncbi:MAG TPA: hypothetical protein DCL21_03065, partial [Alphaproteobacteria bacterium]|nr:hypothetical protein [Alphaproteobacteria bacterium]
MLEHKLSKISGGVAPFMMGIIIGVSIVSTLAAQQAFQENEVYKRKYIDEKKNYIEKVNKNFENLVYTENSTDSTITQDRIKKNIYTNIFDTNLNLNVHQGTQANGVKTGSIDLESNEYIKKNTEDATDANRLAKDFSNSATVIYS